MKITLTEQMFDLYNKYKVDGIDLIILSYIAQSDDCVTNNQLSKICGINTRSATNRITNLINIGLIDSKRRLTNLINFEDVFLDSHYGPEVTSGLEEERDSISNLDESRTLNRVEEETSSPHIPSLDELFEASADDFEDYVEEEPSISTPTSDSFFSYSSVGEMEEGIDSLIPEEPPQPSQIKPIIFLCDLADNSESTFALCDNLDWERYNNPDFYEKTFCGAVCDKMRDGVELLTVLDCIEDCVNFEEAKAEVEKIDSGI